MGNPINSDHSTQTSTHTHTHIRHKCNKCEHAQFIKEKKRRKQKQKNIFHFRYLIAEYLLAKTQKEYSLSLISNIEAYHETFSLLNDTNFTCGETVNQVVDRFSYLLFNDAFEYHGVSQPKTCKPNGNV